MFTRHLEFSLSHAHRELMSLSYVKSDDCPQIYTICVLSDVLGFRNVESDQNPQNL